jgi:N6-L-threonylcarbamoyladenine synthase
MQNFNKPILAIESSCDDTSCAVLLHRCVLSNVVASQKIHSVYGGVVPELASRDHQKNIVPVVFSALKMAGVAVSDLGAIAVTQGPGLSGSLLVGLSFAKSLSASLGIPLIGVNHMEAHVLAHLIDDAGGNKPSFPFICLTVSGGHTQLIQVNAPNQMEVLGETIDDAVGEAFDKAAKLLGLPYPGGPEIDKLARLGNPNRFKFATTQVPGYNFSFSGIKTSFLYFLRDREKESPGFISQNLGDICASYQAHLIHVLLKNAEKVLISTGIGDFALAGGVSANSGLREAVDVLGKKLGISTYVPKFEYCTDNAAMVGIAGYYKWQSGSVDSLDIVPKTRMPLGK